MTSSAPPRRWPRWVYATGDEPDPRFTLANERTYLAWVRTALALLAGGVALEALGVPLDDGARLAASLTCLGLGTVVPPLAWVSWGRTERAIRRGVALPSSVLGPVVTVGACVAGLAVAAGLLLP